MMMEERDITYHFDLLVLLYSFLSFFLKSILFPFGFGLTDLSEDFDITIMLYIVPGRVFNIPPMSRISQRTLGV